MIPLIQSGRTAAKSAEELVRIWVELEDGTPWVTLSPLPRYDADLILYGIVHSIQPHFILPPDRWHQRVVKARLVFEP
jgi:hypothetical protein